MEEITILQNGYDGLYMSYLYGKVRERFSFLPAECDLKRQGNSSKIEFKTEKEYCPYVRKFTENHIADVIVIGYKYAFFEDRLKLPLLSKLKRRLLLTALVAADYKEDRGFVIRRLRGFESYCLDGLFNFRLRDLKKRWIEVADYIPTDMGESSLESFLGFLIEDGTGKIYVKNGKVYDEEYRPVSKSLLTGVESLIGEIIIAGAERVYCFGEVDEATKSFLEKYYGEKATFC